MQEEKVIGLKDLAPDSITLTLDGKEYTLEYSFLSLRELEIIYGSEEGYNRVANMFIQEPDKIKREDIIHFLYAGLLHTDLFERLIDKRIWPWKISREGCKEYISSKLIKREILKYVMLIIGGWLLSTITPEMAEMLDVMSQSGDEGQKKNPA